MAESAAAVTPRLLLTLYRQSPSTHDMTANITWKPPYSAQRAHVHALVRSHSRPSSIVFLRSIMYALLEELRRYNTDPFWLCPRYAADIHAYHAVVKVYYDDCQSLFAPIRRLPPEILLEIFLFYSEAFGPPPLERFPPYQLDEELERLANGRLLTLSRVCARWHSIVIGTPMLWKVFQLNSILWSTPSGLEKTMQILADGLERSCNVPITVKIFDQLFLPPPTRLFDLLARHSERWQVAHITSSIEDIDLSVLKGKLPLLQFFIISVSGSKSPEQSATQILNLCQDAPCLKIVYIPIVLLEKITVPFQQLDVLACEVSGPASVSRAVSVMSKLRRGASYHLQFFSRDEANPLIPLRIPPTTSTISLLDWRIVGDIYTRHYNHALGEFLANLTLPNLTELRLMCDKYPRQEFLNLCARSGFERCLKVLRIPDVLITEEDLIQLLSRLESLEHLEIADRHGEGTDSVLVTDTFLRAIALPAASSHMPHLVPRLHHFACVSKMGFTGNVFIDFVISRLVGCSPENPFSVYLCPPTYIDMALHCAAPVHAAMEQLVARSKRRLSYEYRGYLDLL